jgi:hypothetical protein
MDEKYALNWIVMGGFQMGANTYLGTNNHVRQW